MTSEDLVQKYRREEVKGRNIATILAVTITCILCGLILGFDKSLENATVYIPSCVLLGALLYMMFTATFSLSADEKFSEKNRELVSTFNANQPIIRRALLSIKIEYDGQIDVTYVEDNETITESVFDAEIRHVSADQQLTLQYREIFDSGTMIKVEMYINIPLPASQ